MLSDTAFFLVARDHKVLVITSGQLYQDAGAKLPVREEVAGVQVRRVATSRFGRRNVVGRSLDYLTFYVGAAVALWQVARPGTIVIAKTDPPLISIPAELVCWLRGARLVNWLQDLFPEVAAVAGAWFAKGPVGWFLAWLRDRSLHQAACNVVLGERMAAFVRQRGVHETRIAVIPNWADGRAVRPVGPNENRLREEWGLSGRFVAAYSGNMGRVHEFDTILGAARKLARTPGIKFLFIGAGHWHGRIERTVEGEGLGNIVFKPYQPNDQLAYSLGTGDVHLVSLLPEMEGLVVPSKFYGIAAAGRPTVFVGDPEGEIQRILARHDIGTTVRPGDVDGLVAVLLDLKANPEKRLAMGTRARAVFEAEYDKPIAMAKWEAVLRDVERPEKRPFDDRVAE